MLNIRQVQGVSEAYDQNVHLVHCGSKRTNNAEIGEYKTQKHA